MKLTTFDKRKEELQLGVSDSINNEAVTSNHHLVISRKIPNFHELNLK